MDFHDKDFVLPVLHRAPNDTFARRSIWYCVCLCFFCVYFCFCYSFCLPNCIPLSMSSALDLLKLLDRSNHVKLPPKISSFCWLHVSIHVLPSSFGLTAVRFIVHQEEMQSNRLMSINNRKRVMLWHQATGYSSPIELLRPHFSWFLASLHEKTVLMPHWSCDCIEIEPPGSL